MKVTQQKNKLEIKVKQCKNVERPLHNPLLPDSLRVGCLGKSNSGKSSLVLALLEHPNGIKFQNIYLLSKTVHQPQYQRFKQIMDTIPFMRFYYFNSTNEFPEYSNITPYSVCIFDDIGCEKGQNVIKNIFSYGRHKHLSCFYLSQSYTKIPKTLVRDNLNLIILFQTDFKNLKHVHQEFAAEISFSDLIKMCRLAWKQPYGFLVIAPDDYKNGKYRIGFDRFITL